MSPSADPVGGIDYPRTYQEFGPGFLMTRLVASISPGSAGRPVSRARTVAMAGAGTLGEGFECASSAP